MRFTNFGEKQSFEKESFVGKFQMESVSPNLAKKKSFEKESLKFREKRGKFGC